MDNFYCALPFKMDSTYLKNKLPFKKYVTHLGVKGLTKMIPKCDIGGKGSKAKSDVTSLKKYCLRNLIFLLMRFIVTIVLTF